MTSPERAVIGLDLSLTATGVACDHNCSKATTNLRGCERLIFVRDYVADLTHKHLLPFVVIEGFSFGSNNRSAREIGGLGWVVRVMLHETQVPWIEVPPATLKKYATGKGNVGKVEMVVSARERLGYEGHDDNEADALWLRAIGLELLGRPLVELPKTHRDALAKVTLPEGLTIHERGAA